MKRVLIVLFLIVAAIVACFSEGEPDYGRGTPTSTPKADIVCTDCLGG